MAPISLPRFAHPVLAKIHIRLPPDDRGGTGAGGSTQDTGGSTANPGPVLNPHGYGSGASRRAGDGEGRVFLGRYDDRSGLADCREDGDSGGGGGGGGGGSGGESAAAGSCANAAPGAAASADSAATRSESSSAGASLELELPPPSPEIFYSMKLVTGKDAVGTLSGPGTLGIERCTARAGEAGAGVDEGGSGGGGAVCGAPVEDKRSTVVQTLVDAFSWGKGGEAAAKAGAAGGGALAKGERDAVSSQTGGESEGAGCFAAGYMRGARQACRFVWFQYVAREVDFRCFVASRSCETVVLFSSPWRFRGVSRGQLVYGCAARRAGMESSAESYHEYITARNLGFWLFAPRNDEKAKALPRPTTTTLPSLCCLQGKLGV